MYGSSAERTWLLGTIRHKLLAAAMLEMFCTCLALYRISLKSFRKGKILVVGLDLYKEYPMIPWLGFVNRITHLCNNVKILSFRAIGQALAKCWSEIFVCSQH